MANLESKVAELAERLAKVEARLPPNVVFKDGLGWLPESGALASAEGRPVCKAWCGTGEPPVGALRWGGEAWCSKECARKCWPQRSHSLMREAAKDSPAWKCPGTEKCNDDACPNVHTPAPYTPPGFPTIAPSGASTVRGWSTEPAPQPESPAVCSTCIHSGERVRGCRTAARGENEKPCMRCGTPTLGRVVAREKPEAPAGTCPESFGGSDFGDFEPLPAEPSSDAPECVRCGAADPTYMDGEGRMYCRPCARGGVFVPPAPSEPAKAPLSRFPDGSIGRMVQQIKEAHPDVILLRAQISEALDLYAKKADEVGALEQRLSGYKKAYDATCDDVADLEARLAAAEKKRDDAIAEVAEMQVMTSRWKQLRDNSVAAERKRCAYYGDRIYMATTADGMRAALAAIASGAAVPGGE